MILVSLTRPTCPPLEYNDQINSTTPIQVNTSKLKIAALGATYHHPCETDNRQ